MSVNQGLVITALVCLVLVPAALCQQSGPLPTPPPPAAAQQRQAQPTNAKTAETTQRTTAPASSRAESDPKLALPAGTHIPLVLYNAISTRSTKPGDPVYFQSIYPVILNGKIVVPAGSWVSGVVTEAKRAGRIKGRAEVMMRLTTLILPNAYVVSLVAAPSNAGTGGKETTDAEGRIKGDTDKADDAGTVIETTMAGAGIGAIASQTPRGAGIGAGIGAAAGLATVLLSRGPDADLPRGTTLDAVLDHTIMLDGSKINFTSPGQASALPGPPSREQQRNRIPF
jgi:hypothetical protein